MKRKRKRIKKTFSYIGRSNLGLIKKLFRILRWLLPGLLIKRWMVTSAVGLLTAMLGIAIWTELRPIVWLINIIDWTLTSFSTVPPLLGPFILIIGLILIGLGQNRSINSIQKALVPEKDTFLVDALRVKC